MAWRPKRSELSCGGAVSANDAPHRKLCARAGVARARLWWERGGVFARARSARASGLDCWADRVSFAAFDSARIGACLSSPRAMISLTRPAISRPARDAPRGDAPCGDAPCVSITRYPTISPKSPTVPSSEPQSGHRSPIGSTWLSVLYKRVLHAQTIEIRHRQTLLVPSRAIAAGARSADRSDRDRRGRPGSGCRPLAGRSGVVGHRSLTKPDG